MDDVVKGDMSEEMDQSRYSYDQAETKAMDLKGGC